MHDLEGKYLCFVRKSHWHFFYYSGFRIRKAHVRKCNRFPRQKGGHGPRRSMRSRHRPRKLGTYHATLLARDVIQCFVEESFGKLSIVPYSFISRTKMPIFFHKGRSSSYILENQPGKLMLETFSWDNNVEIEIEIEIENFIYPRNPFTTKWYSKEPCLIQHTN